MVRGRVRVRVGVRVRIGVRVGARLRLRLRLRARLRLRLRLRLRARLRLRLGLTRHDRGRLHGPLDGAEGVVQGALDLVEHVHVGAAEQAAAGALGLAPLDDEVVVVADALLNDLVVSS